MQSVLVVDDNPVNLKMIQEILKDMYKVYPAPSGERAINFLERTIPDLILLDIEMPGMNGLAVINRLKQDARWLEIPVIFLTVLDDRVKEEQAFQMGAVDYIHKPVSAGVMLKRIHLHIELQKYRKTLEKLVEVKTNQLLRSQDTILEILVNVTSYRDNATGGHIQRTSFFTERIVNCLFEIGLHRYRLNRNYADNIIKSAKLHDIGKVGISDTILLKPGRLSEWEYKEIKKHTTLGAKMIDDAMRELGDDSTFLLVAKEIVYSHHEWWNGRGYPLGISGEDIPLSGRIMAVSDVYDALVSDRPYKKAYTHDQAMEIMREESGTHFDPYLMKIINNIMQEFAEVASQIQENTFELV
ncbi:MAG: response regulator [Clostridiales bacterium]|jgi:putative two-component system response regulator|nr:response regulator [Clostridiales bacterium]